MTKKIIAVDLIVPDTVTFYGPRTSSQGTHSTHPKRQKVRGKLRLITSRPTKLSLVEIKFKGQAHLSWRDPLKSQHAFLVSRINASMTLRKTKSILLEDAILPAGVTDLGFEVAVPGYLCPTFESEYLRISYRLTARVLPTGKFEKEWLVHREMQLLKTLMPKDVSAGHVRGYVVPHQKMMGERALTVGWEFNVPGWVCLEGQQGVEFVGMIKTLVGPESVEISRIEVDVVQEEIYRQDSSDLVSKRHLVRCAHPPSVYLHPPLDSLISFSFPLQPLGSPGQQNRALAEASQPVSTCGHATTVTWGDFTYSLDSPFLEIRHYVRLVLYLATTDGRVLPPVCIGLPIDVTREIRHQQLDTDALPSYQAITRDGERLPLYSCAIREDEALCGAPFNRSLPLSDPLNDRVWERVIASIAGLPEQSFVPPNQSNRRRKRTEDTLIEERCIHDFCLV
ncbi:hypothetical protein J3Q64DRAFT_1707296 [Phycomyces blakesleeanus]|uniref:Arrestin-like N-terminal domain-containing protein n=2 Tax=Phycomyces blakesleeanus TaxID=4837 RepID=A0A163E9T7_PHYB8|nr:hypothetical protein PHYBLDRAFT_179898 [Phycomyces blakesleeanus NRRL 1555(-)]OAD77550.1 hypothetical protein PHYBLDRAFT_179898 [Phycomyces blakesleeanus NRRL 1555(-)]|eukprot:XP_018295590.1 hypothetical protein PHYBLDRAFT_179898 [Phycomyces blakesleeanus NRRL 1555(-)]